MNDSHDGWCADAALGSRNGRLGRPAAGRQSDRAFAASYAANGVVNVSATTQRVSCYAPKVPYSTALSAAAGYPAAARRLPGRHNR